ncbi:SAVED domain-containing protein [Cupriavidus sp. amp6]|uniref:SAVED domain-containing protein n=1 Tax=Cupriavidus sp. amp6 TaxID=388051 RepID=UPI00048D1FEF|nr:SAVED domain-containing protein [Cupriavidus sp. amp6]
MVELLRWCRGVADRLIDWFLRPTNVGLRLVQGGMGLFGIASAGNWLFNVNADTPWGKFSFQLSNPGSTSDFLTSAAALLALLMIVGGAVFAVINQVRINRLQTRQRVLVLEMRGLADTSDAPLKDAIPKRLTGIPESVLVDVRQHMQSNSTSSLGVVLDELSGIPRDLGSRRKDFARSDISTVVGGILPVPFLFHVGVLLDDESHVTLMDWERTEGEWRDLAEPDDGRRFEICGLEQLQHGVHKEVVVAVSASYSVDEQGIAETFAGFAVVHLRVPSPMPNALWSEAKQQALANQFLQTLGIVASGGTEMVHLILAAPASLAIRLGSSYDVRNFPAAIAYQYERTQQNKYPWGVRLRTHGVTRAEIVETNRATMVA